MPISEVALTTIDDIDGVGHDDEDGDDDHPPILNPPHLSLSPSMTLAITLCGRLFFRTVKPAKKRPWQRRAASLGSLLSSRSLTVWSIFPAQRILRQLVMRSWTWPVRAMGVSRAGVGAGGGQYVGVLCGGVLWMCCTRVDGGLGCSDCVVWVFYLWVC